MWRACTPQISYPYAVGTSDTSANVADDDVASLKALVVEKSALVISQAALIAILEEKLRLAVHQRFAPTSEKLSTLAQLNLFNEAEAAASAQCDTPPAPDAAADLTTVPEHVRERGKRKPIDAKLPRVRVEHDIPETQKKCPCGCALSRIGEAISEQFDIVPARAQVLQHVRFKYACRTCEGTSHDGAAVIIAEMPAQPIPKSNASPGLLSHISVAKFQDGMPLYRVSGILARDGIDVSRTTMATWMIRIAQLVTPLINLMDDVNGTLNLTRVCREWQLGTDPPALCGMPPLDKGSMPLKPFLASPISSWRPPPQLALGPVVGGRGCRRGVCL